MNIVQSNALSKKTTRLFMSPVNLWYSITFSRKHAEKFTFKKNGYSVKFMVLNESFGQIDFEIKYTVQYTEILLFINTSK